MSDKKINVAIIGLGFGAEFIPIYQRHPNANMYAICQRTQSRLDEVGDTFEPQDQPSADLEGDELPQTDGTSPDIAAIVDVTDDVAPTISLASADDEDEDEAAPEPRTYYQRSTGIPLSERIKIARKSG